MVKLPFNQQAWSNCSSHFHGWFKNLFLYVQLLNIYSDALMTLHERKPGFLDTSKLGYMNVGPT